MEFDFFFFILLEICRYEIIICDALGDLVPFIQFKNRETAKNRKVAGFSLQK